MRGNWQGYCDLIFLLQLIYNVFLLSQGCTHPNTYEPVVGVLADMIPLLELPVIDPTQSMAFPMTVVALLPYMLLHYEDATELCVRAACHIAQVNKITIFNNIKFWLYPSIPTVEI